MEGTSSEKTISGLPPKPFMSPSNTSRGKEPARVKDPTIDLQQAVALYSQNPNISDDKKLKRSLAARQYSWTHRLKQREYFAQLETVTKILQVENEFMASKIKYRNYINELLRTEKASLEQNLFSCIDEKNFKEAKYEEMKKEKDELKQLYRYLQQMQLNHQN
ncbi:hypothetical protein Ddye_002101 [Dipteronia dyeriana]|uniref:Uncharacterized protein n=1 Tax=Dipteronia dyeriana TaxID=168575 RepID=A0AAD9XQV8_9ROSI|nr:hypothetical protein Ddye_002101 [Dipteronia dyeriana]